MGSINIIPGQTGQAIAVFGKKTKKAKAVNLLTAGGVEYKWTVKLDQEGRGGAPVGPHHFTHSDTKEEKKIFEITTVDEPGKMLPHSTSIFSPDFLVTSGDGVNFMAGSGKVITDNFSPHRKESFSQCSTEKTYSWEFRRMKKK